MDEITEKIIAYNKKALDIIAKYKLDFKTFHYSTNYYEYNININRRYHKRIPATDFLILKAVINCNIKLLEVL